MMKKLLYVLVAFWVFGSNFYAQEQSDHKGSVLNGGAVFKDTGKNLQIQFQIGSQFLYPLDANQHIKSGFPFGVYYVPNTFNENTFEVSKGYYEDNIRISWSIGANEDNIDKIQIFRKPLEGSSPYNLIATLGKDVFEYEDTQIDGGKLYQYKVSAVGISQVEQKFVTFIEGIGYRNPTAFVSGSITFEGGSPVKDVTVFAEPIGAKSTTVGSSMQFTDLVEKLNLSEDFVDKDAKELTLQAWVAPSLDEANQKPFIFSTQNGSIYQLEFYYAADAAGRKMVLNFKDGSTLVHGFELKGSYPTGKINARGDDVFANTSDVTSSRFVHVTVGLKNNAVPKIYLNGREINQNYIDNVTTQENVTTSEIENIVSNVYNAGSEKLRGVSLGSDFIGYIDEFRLWSRTLTDAEIRRDYKRYLDGSETGLEMYNRMDEAFGNYAYDLSKTGFNFHKKDFIKSAVNSTKTKFSDVVPTNQQLGIFGITDEDGSYSISAIPYAGSGEQFKITPSFGVHKFKPASQTLFLGTEESVVNQVNFEDISSFKYNGRIVYDTRNVFNSIPISDSSLQTITEIREKGYNQYLVNGTITINKGQYYYEGGELDTVSGNLINGTLKQYPIIGLEGANIYIDGDIVFDEDNQPVVTDAEGKFAINVPIGRHKIEVNKEGHTFSLDGRFPEKTSNAETNLFDFYEDQIQERWFIDNSRVTIVGRIVGGRIESNKEIGFGFNGLKEHNNTVADDEPEDKQTYSSINNIGKATITLKGDINTNELDFTFETNVETGEYKISILPLIYTVRKSGGIHVASNPEINGLFLDSNEELNFTEIKDEETSTFTSNDNTQYESEPYQYVKNFRYNSPVILKLITQEFDKEFKINNTAFDISEFDVPLYTQKKQYRMLFEVTQDYINKDADDDVVTQEYFNEGKFNINNNFASSNPNDSKIQLVKQNRKEQYVYSFRAGLPNITQTSGFKNEVTVEYTIPDSNPISIVNASNFKNEGIIIGGRSAEGTTFSTVAPEVPDIILRDPPGSNSFASIEKGTTISFEKTNGKSSSDTAAGGLYVSVGPTFESEAGTPFFSVQSELNFVANTEANFSKTQEINADGSTTETYEFSETISTSDDPNFVGADGDLYIGNAKNIYYGLFNNMFVTKEIPKLPNGTTVPNIVVQAKDEDGNPETLYISSRKDYFIAEQPSNTFFIYSQKHIIETLIPELQSIANSLSNGVKPDPTKDYQSPNFYIKQIESWQRIIQDNERDKYLALKDRASIKTRALTKINIEKQRRQERIDELKNLPFGLALGYRFTEYDQYIDGLGDLFSANFESNKSFDSGVGEFTSSITSTTVSTKTYEKTIDLSEEFQTQLGFLQNDVGFTATIAGSSSNVTTNSESLTNEYSTTISYTLKDNDQSNVLSVDVVNMFDGFGPIFITKGGATSCPYEGPTVSNFYKHSEYDANNITIGAGGENLTEGTVNVFKPELKVNKTQITNLPESEGALFTLILKNLSNTGDDLEHKLYVDQATLNGAISNIDQNGISVLLPYNEEVEIPLIITKNSSSDVYNYENIRVYLANPCNDLNDSDAFVDVSVEFKKSCSKVAISAPQNNWVFNRTEAFNYDNEGNLIGTNNQPITFTDFNTDFSGFRKIILEYRNENSSSWTKFKAYYGSEQLKNEASDDDGIVISSESEFTFNWDIIGSSINDGSYEIRAVAFCTDDITYESEIINGTINLTAPVLFGTPEPSDGILDIGEDIKVRFNETITEHVSTNIILRGLKNQQAIDHSISVTLDGSNNQIELPKQDLMSNSFSIQFWLDNKTTENGVLLQQENGPKISLNGDNVSFELDGEVIETLIDGSQYNFYSFIYKDGDNPILRVLQNGTELKIKNLDRELSFNNNNSIFVGGSNILGNIHDIRIWSKATTSGLAAAEKDFTLSGNELNLMAYWPLNEGNGVVGKELVRNRNASVNLSWSIKPKGQGYAFDANSYLTLDKVGFAQPTNLEDITISFWLKAASGDSGTIFSNGSGNANLGEPILSNGFRNKWNIELLTNGTLKLRTEGKDFSLTTTSVSDNNWHHFALVVRRNGGLTTFIDGVQNVNASSQNIGGIASAKMYLGAKYTRHVPQDENGNATGNATETIDNFFTGKLDEFRLWNTARSFEQIKRDRYFEVDRDTEGLLLYSKFNEEDANLSDKGPRYNIRRGDGVVLGYLADLNGASRKFIEDSPAIKPALDYINIPFTTVINADEMIVSPTLTNEEWSLFEGQILDISVANMYDIHFNKQLSPVSFSAFVNRQEIEWFTQAGNKEIVTEKIANEPFSFTMDVVNKGGNNQDFSITSLPNYITVSATSGTVGPDAVKQIKFTVDDELAMGSYNTDIYLQLDNGYSDRLNVQLRVIQEAPDWSVKASDYSYNMNIISQIKIYNQFSRDTYTKVGAFVDNQKRGEAYLVYDKNYDAYYAFLTVYSNVTAGETVTFKVWDALNGKIRVASIDGEQSTTFLQNDVKGTKSSPIIFNSGNFSEQNINLNKGWTWVSYFVEDNRFNSIDNTFENLNLEDGDLIKYGPEFTRYENGFWSGSLTTLENSKAYKINLNQENTLRLIGNEVDAKNLDINVASGWNWFAFPIHRNISVSEALAFFDPSDGDVIKDQFNFAIYDANAREWTGTLRYFQANRGYMLRAQNAQTFNYPNLNNLSRTNGSQDTFNELVEFSKYQNTMGVIAEVHGSENFNQVKVFDTNNNLRGISKIENSNGKRIAFITVFSDASETLYFKLVDSSSETSLSETVTFNSNVVLGTLKTPISLNQKELSTDNIAFKKVSIYPNPFTNEISINTSANKEVSKIIIYNAIGIKVLEQKITKDITVLHTNNLAAGIYMFKIMANNGKHIIKKIVKAN